MSDSGSDLGEEDKMWGVTGNDRITLATDSDSGGHHHSKPPSQQRHQHSREEECDRVLQDQMQRAGGTLKKAYLLPKDHVLHIPPHVVLSRMEDQVDDLMTTLRELQYRNYEKDKGKQFEGSYTRVGFIMIITYFTLCAYMIAIDVSAPFLNAIVPTVGFNLSTWSLPWVKQIWMGIYDFNWGKPKEFQPPGIHSHSSHTAPEGSTTRPPLNVDDSNSMI